MHLVGMTAHVFDLSIHLLIQTNLYEPRSEKTGLRDFRPGPTQTGLYNQRRWLEG